MTDEQPAEAGSLSVIHVHALLEALEQHGVRGRDFLGSVGFEVGLLELPSAWIEAAEYDRLIERALHVTGDPAFGLSWGERSTLMKYDLITPLVTTARTLRIALDAITRFQRLLNENRQIAVEVQGATAVIALRLDPPPSLTRRVRAEVGMVGMARTLQYYGGADGVARRLAFDYAAPAYAAEYIRIFGPRVEFDAPEIALEFDAALLDVPQLQHNARIYEVAEREAELALGQLLREKQHTERLRRHLDRVFPALPDMDQAARQLGMAERSLRRRLAAEGASFHELLVEARVNGALRLLRNPDCSVKEAAYRMGFASSSAFHRAFKRWTGMSPSEARRGR